MSTVYPIEWEPIVVTGRYRNLQRRDTATWERWIEKHGSEFLRVAYDVAVGGSYPDDPSATEKDKLGWRYTTAQKIDLLLEDHEGITVVEVKPTASLTAIGGAVGYPLVLARDEPALTLVTGAIICGHLPADIKYIADALGVKVWVV